MRKTRLVILPTKCLHQMGFLLLFLSCPVIGDWGRIRPESENSHNAIQIEREGTCGLQRDPPGALLDVLSENGPKQCRLDEEYDLNKVTQQPVSEVYTRREDIRRMSQRRDVRASQRIVRSRSVEYRRYSGERSMERNERVRSISLNRLENERTVRGQRNDIRYNRREADFPSRRLSLSRRMNERQDERRVDQRRLYRDIRNDRREDDTRRSLRSTERADIRRENNERATLRRQNDVTRRLTMERTQRNVRERSDRRLTVEDTARRMERSENRRTSERRSTEVRAIRQTRSLEREETTRINRNVDKQREIDNRRVLALSPKRIDRLDALRETRMRVDPKPRINNDDLNLENNKHEAFLGGVRKWMDLKSYESSKIGDWTTNCVIGAVAYFLTSRQVKTV